MNIRPFLTLAASPGVIGNTELAYQRKLLRVKWRWLRWIGRAVRLAGITLAMIIFGGLVTGALLERDSYTIIKRLGDLVPILLFFTLLMHFVYLYQTLSLSSNSITHERQSSTWELLLLTRINSWQMVYGKWWATVRRQMRSYFTLGLLQMGVMAVSASFSWGFIYSGYYNDISFFRFPTVFQIVAAGAVVMVLTLADLGFTAALGVLASASTGRTWKALGQALVTRVLLMILVWFIASRFTYEQGWLAMGLMTLIENGLLLTGDLASVRYVSPANDYPFTTVPYASIVLVTLLVYAAVTLCLLLLAMARLDGEVGMD